jgi:hypothetical protein
MSRDAVTYSNSGHLACYGLPLTNFDTGDLAGHLQRREFLYLDIGLPHVALKGARVFKVAAGTGQNSVYVACCKPAALTRPEPNPVSRNELMPFYSGLRPLHTSPTVETDLLQNFNPGELYEIVDSSRRSLFHVT